MDLSLYTPIYVRLTGDNANDGLTPSTPKRTVQDAFDAALAGEGDFVLDVGSGNFSGVILRTDTGAVDWPERIAVRGAGQTISFFGGIDANGNPAFDDPAPVGRTVNLKSDLSINFGNITSNASTYSIDGYDGGNISLYDCIAGNVSANGSEIGSAAGNGGTILISGSFVGNVQSLGAWGGFGYSGGNGGKITLISSSGGNVSSYAGPGDDGDYGLGGRGGDINIIYSIAGNINSMGGRGGHLFDVLNPNGGGDGGNVLIDHSTVGNITTEGGDGRQFHGGDGGNGGNLTLIFSKVGAISTLGGSGGADNGATPSTFINGVIGTTTIIGPPKFKKSTTVSTILNFSTGYVPPNILGAGLL